MPLATYYELLKDYIEFQTIQDTTIFAIEAEKTINRFSKILKKSGFEVQNHAIQSIPTLVAKYIHNKNLPTVIIYTYYDLIMSEVSNDWKNNPFNLYLGKDEIIGKGVAENKGQFLACLTSISHLIDEGKLGYNVIFLIDGCQNHIGANIKTFLEESYEELQSDFCFCCAGQGVLESPTIDIAQRGSMNFDIILSGNEINPLREMSKLISKGYTFNGKVAIPYFYYNIQGYKPTVEVKRYGTNMEYKTITKSQKPSYTTLEPTLDLTGIVSLPKFDKSQSIPKKVVANFQMKLVADQNYPEMIKGLQQWLKTIAPTQLKTELIIHEAFNPIKLPLTNFYAQKAFSLIMKNRDQTPENQQKKIGIKALEAIQSTICPTILSIPFANKSSNIGETNENLKNEQVKKIFDFCTEFFKG
ncbi:hypothetical protein AGMMS50249_7100 [candidate division SR1 bacterium]|nr:hypothetical protein AGMMS50249_7100 [candidate division SR1 bacterium]